MARPRKTAVKKQDALLNPQEVPEIPLEEQPYPLPKGWKWVRLGSVAEIIMGQSPAGSETTDDNSFLPLIGGASDMGILYPEPGKYTKKPTKISNDTDIIICIRATLGRPIFSDGKYCLGRGVAAIRSQVLNSKFLRFFILNFEQYLFDNATGSTFAQVNSSTLHQMPLPLPPRHERQRIVNSIESLFSKLDEAKEQAEAVLDGYEPRKAAILHKAFSGELTKTWRIEHGHKKKEWQNLTLNDVAKWGSGGTPSRKQPDYYTGDIAWVKTGELNNDYLYETEEHITKDAIKNSSAKIFPKETVIIAMYGATIGQCAILGIDAATNQACACAIVKQNTYNKFLFNYLISQKNNFINLGKGGAQPNISQTIIKEYPISLPTLPEQREIVRILDVLLAKEQRVKEAAETVLEQIELMKKSILARAFRGDLTTYHYR